jgi:hypothetical protein
MKNGIKKWLGITELENSGPQKIEKSTLRKMVAECVQDALNGKDDYFERTWFTSRIEMQSSLERVIERYASEKAESVAKREIALRVDKETFIDQVAERIRIKQV